MGRDHTNEIDLTGHSLVVEDKDAFDYADVDNFDRLTDQNIKQHGFLTYDVKTADLTKYPLHQLESRLAHYERELLFERNRRVASEYTQEISRTKVELNRRKLYQRAEADRVFEL